MTRSGMDETRALLENLNDLVSGGGTARAEEDLEAKARLLGITAELSKRLVDLESRLRESPPGDGSHAVRLTSLGRATAEVGYRINNLLSVIGARIDVAEMCLGGDDPDKALRNIRMAKEQCRQVQTMAVALIDFSGEREHRFRSDLNELIRGTVSFARLLSHYENIEFDLNLAADLAPLSLDPARWQQLLLSLFANAADAEGKRKGEGGRIHIFTSNRHDEKSVRLVVEDEGRGIAPEVLPRVFEPGFSTKAGQGQGFGLYACRTIVEEAGGTIRVESAPGEGTKVIVSVPQSG
jgi:signal transduction histidine kinase